MRLYRVAALLAVLLCALGGCTARPPQTPVVIAGDDPTAPVPTKPLLDDSGAVGTLDGLVTDKFSKPVRGAKVVLLGTDDARTTAANGTFTMDGLKVGTYGIQASRPGYSSASGTVTIASGQTTRAWLQLRPPAPPPAWHETFSFNGTTLVSDNAVLAGLEPYCDGCYQSLSFKPWIRSVIIEYSLDEDSPIPVNPFPDPFDMRNFTTYWALEGRTAYQDGYGPNPLWARVDDVETGNSTLYIDPGTYPAPQVNRPFHIHVSAFYVDPPPVGWSYLAGSR